MIVVLAILAAVLLVVGGLRGGMDLALVVLGALAVIALGVVVAAVARRASPQVSSLLTAVGAAVIAASIGWSSVEIVRFARNPTVKVVVDNRCDVPLTVTGRDVSVAARTREEFDAPGIVVEVHRTEAQVVGEASLGEASIPLAGDASLTIDDESMAVGDSRTIDLADYDTLLVVPCG